MGGILDLLPARSDRQRRRQQHPEQLRRDGPGFVRFVDDRQYEQRPDIGRVKIGRPPRPDGPDPSRQDWRDAATARRPERRSSRLNRPGQFALFDRNGRYGECVHDHQPHRRNTTSSSAATKPGRFVPLGQVDGDFGSPINDDLEDLLLTPIGLGTAVNGNANSAGVTGPDRWARTSGAGEGMRLDFVEDLSGIPTSGKMIILWRAEPRLRRALLRQRRNHAVSTRGPRHSQHAASRRSWSRLKSLTTMVTTTQPIWSMERGRSFP